MKRYLLFAAGAALLAFNLYNYGDATTLFFATFSTKKAVFFGALGAYLSLCLALATSFPEKGP